MRLWVATIFMGIVLLAHPLCVNPTHAACAKVVLEIPQTLTLERVAFDAKLVLSNGVPDTALENIRLDITIKDNSGTAQDSLFFIRKPVLSGVNALDGTGTVGAGGKAEAHWLIIPSPGAGVVKENGLATQIGVEYWVGATLTYTILGKEEIVPILPKKITVNPMPELVLDYFMPYQVNGDNPFTPQVEAAVPYPVAVRVMNDGYGSAVKLRINSAQPKIIENNQGLLIDFKILGSAVNDNPVDPSLLVNFGDLGSKKAATAYWRLISTLAGRFIEFKAEYSHASDLGGELTSLLRETNTHYLTHMIKVNLPGRDKRLDFLGYDTNLADNPDKLPHYIYESEIPNGGGDIAASRSTVTVLNPMAAPGRPTPENRSVSLTLPLTATGWIYTKLADPSQGMLKLLDVARGDGVHLDPNNFWVDEGLDENYQKTWTLQFVDYRSYDTVSGSYTLIYAKPDIDTTPPVSTLIFDGPTTGANPVLLTPLTRIIVTASDNDGGSGVSALYRKVEGQDQQFFPAYPFTIEQPGAYTVSCYSTDRAGNAENAHATPVKIVADAPTVAAFIATPTTFAPQAPKGVAAKRTVDFTLTAQSVAPSLAVTLDIKPTATPTATPLRTLKGTATPGASLRLVWDGLDTSGKPAPSGSYLARVSVSDGLDNLQDQNAPLHTTTADVTVTVGDWLRTTPVDPNPTAAQLHPRISATTVVWQDQRNSVWDIYYRELTAGAATRLTTGTVDHQWPAIDGTIIVWQDYRNGKWDIYGYDLTSRQEFTVAAGPGSKERPAISGDWIAWQDNRNGNWDIYTYNRLTQETIRVTSHERDQIHPALSGNNLVWEDYRHGLGAIYRYDLTTRTESRVTLDPANHTNPAVAAGTIVWTDDRNSQRDIYEYDPAQGTLRVTYAGGDHGQPALLNGLLVYTDYEAGLDDPNLSFRFLAGGAGGRLTSDPARQEEPALGTKLVVWQDNRDGNFQVYSAPLDTEAAPITVDLKPGLNLVAVGASLASQYSTAAAFLAAKGTELGIDRIMALDPLHNSYTIADPSGGDFVLSKGQGLGIYVRKAASLKLADSGETATYTLYAGANQIGLLSLPYGYTVYDLINSLGSANVRSVRRFDSATGAWQSVATRVPENSVEIVGANFVILSGDAVQVTMKSRVDGWNP